MSTASRFRLLLRFHGHSGPPAMRDLWVSKCCDSALVAKNRWGEQFSEAAIALVSYRIGRHFLRSSFRHWLKVSRWNQRGVDIHTWTTEVHWLRACRAADPSNLKQKAQCNSLATGFKGRHFTAGFNLRQVSYQCFPHVFLFRQG